MVEECLEDMRELNCAIMHTPYGYRSSAVEEVIHHGDLLGYDEKYIGKTEKTEYKSKNVCGSGKKNWWKKYKSVQ